MKKKEKEKKEEDDESIMGWRWKDDEDLMMVKGQSKIKREKYIRKLYYNVFMCP